MVELAQGYIICSVMFCNPKCYFMLCLILYYYKFWKEKVQTSDIITSFFSYVFWLHWFEAVRCIYKIAENYLSDYKISMTITGFEHILKNILITFTYNCNLCSKSLSQYILESWNFIFNASLSRLIWPANFSYKLEASKVIQNRKVDIT